MITLAIDTATEACSVALKTHNQSYTRFEVCPQQHSQKLLPMVDEVLKEAGLRLRDVDMLAYGRGPGSFTGVRIATGMIQGLALGSGLPVAGISTLQTMAQQALQTTDSAVVAAAIDARMGEVYFGIFERKDGIATLIGEERVCSPADAAASLTEQSDYAKVGTGWAAYPELSVLLNDEDVVIHYPDAASMTVLAERASHDGATTDAMGISPVYLRDKVTWKKLPGRE